jgi:hypothetical protein
MGKKKGGKKGSKKKGKAGPAADAPYEDWMKYLHEQRLAAGAYISNEGVVADVVTKEPPHREWLLKCPPGGPPIVKDQKQYEKVKAKSALFRKVVIFYFAAYKQDLYNDEPFTPTLIELYNNALEANKKVEVVYVPCDVKQEQFEEFFETMPWLSLPFGDPTVAHLRAKFRVSITPKVVIMAQNGQVVTDDGLSKCTRTPNQFPYTKAVSLDAIEQAQRRGNPNPSVLSQCKCKKLEYEKNPSKLYETEYDKENGIKMPNMCTCGSADIYHIPIFVPEEEDPKAKGGKGSKKKKK